MDDPSSHESLAGETSDINVNSGDVVPSATTEGPAIAGNIDAGAGARALAGVGVADESVAVAVDVGVEGDQGPTDPEERRKELQEMQASEGSTLSNQEAAEHRKRVLDLIKAEREKERAQGEEDESDSDDEPMTVPLEDYESPPSDRSILKKSEVEGGSPLQTQVAVRFCSVLVGGESTDKSRYRPNIAEQYTLTKQHYRDYKMKLFRHKGRKVRDEDGGETTKDQSNDGKTGKNDGKNETTNSPSQSSSPKKRRPKPPSTRDAQYDAFYESGTWDHMLPGLRDKGGGVSASFAPGVTVAQGSPLTSAPSLSTSVPDVSSAPARAVTEDDIDVAPQGSRWSKVLAIRKVKSAKSASKLKIGSKKKSRGCRTS